jgi:hypothetical protein
MLGLGDVMLIVSTGIGATTVIVDVAVLLPSAVVQVIVAVPPTVPAVTRPDALTEAILMLLEVQDTF